MKHEEIWLALVYYLTYTNHSSLKISLVIFRRCFLNHFPKVCIVYQILPRKMGRFFCSVNLMSGISRVKIMVVMTPVKLSLFVSEEKFVIK